MSLLPDTPDCWSFVDIGSGKGRAVLLAIGYPFRKVVGIEVVPALHAAAQANLARYRGPRLCADVELACSDATSMALPPGDIVIFFYNSFRGRLLQSLLDNLADSARNTPRRLIFIYSNPTEREAIDAHPAFSILREASSGYDPIWWGNRKLIIYSLKV